MSGPDAGKYSVVKRFLWTLFGVLLMAFWILALLRCVSGVLGYMMD